MKFALVILAIFVVAFLPKAIESATIILSSFDPNQYKRTLPNNDAQIENENYQIQIVRDFIGCLQIENQQCKKCQNDYFLNDQKKCAKISDLCRVFNLDQGLCTECYQTGIIVDGVCYLPNQVPQIKNHCLIWAVNECLKCEKAYYLKDGLCKPVDIQNQCRRWDEKGVCQICNQGFYLNSQKCQQLKNIFQCPSGQFVTKDGKCSFPPANCNTWDIFNNKCVKCFDGFDFVDWKCICSDSGYCAKQNCQRYNIDDRKTCDKCVDGFQLKNGRCMDPLLTDYCAEWSQDQSVCLKCSQNYILNSQKNTCTRNVEKCQAYTESGECISCVDGHEITDDICELKTSLVNSVELYGCDKINITSLKCSECKQNFTLNKQSYCFLDEDHCQQKSDDILCQKCEQDYQIVSGSCQLISDRIIQDKIGCKLYDWVNNLCLMCEDEFIKLQDGVCQKPIHNCIEQRAEGCVKCLPNHDVKDGQCVPYTVSRCVEAVDDSQCKRCEDSFALVQGECRTFKQLGTILLDYAQFDPQKLKQKIIIFTDKLIG